MVPGALELAWGSQVLSCAIHGYDLVSKKGGGAGPARHLLAAAVALQALALGAHWKSAGLWHPPWLTPGESLVFASWVLLALQLAAEARFRVSASGFFVTTISSVLTGLVVFKLGGLASAFHGAFPGASGGIHSIWMWIHRPAGAVGMGLMLLGAFSSVAALLKAGFANERFFSMLGALILPSLCLADPVTRTATAAIGGFALYLVFAAYGFWQEGLDRRLSAERAKLLPHSKPLAARKGYWKTLRLLYGASWFALLVAIREMEGARTPYLVAWLIFLAACSGALHGASSKRKSVAERLPDPENFDRLRYQALLAALPWLTVYLVSGSIASYEAWASYWAWGAAQAFGWIAWLFLALLLHLKPGKVSTHAATAAGLLFVAAAFAAGGLANGR